MVHIFSFFYFFIPHLKFLTSYYLVGKITGTTLNINKIIVYVISNANTADLINVSLSIMAFNIPF